LSQKITRLILPFSALSESRTETFTEEMEKAVIYCFAELERAKSSGLILKKPEEKMLFLAEFCYPLWLAPFNNASLLFDGLKTTMHTMVYKAIPDVKIFMEKANRGSKALETYIAFLSGDANYFQTSGQEKTMAIDALIAEPIFLKEFNLYLSEAKQVETQPKIVTLLPTIDELTISTITQEFKNLKSDLKEDVNFLYETMKLLNKTTHNFVKIIRGKIRTIREEVASEIEKQENIMTPKVDRINEEYEEKIAELTRNFEKQLLTLQKEKVKLEKTKEQILGKIERCNIEAKMHAADKDTVGEKNWKERANESKKEFSDIQVKAEEIEERIKEIEESKSLETFRLRSELEAKVNETRKDLLELEASRDAEIQFHQQEIDKSEHLTSTIIKQIDKMIRSCEADLANFEKLGVQKKHEGQALVYMPFYLVCYRTEEKKRYVIFAPSVANSIGFRTKFKGALGKAKVKQLLVPRFKAVTSLLEKFPILLEGNAAFEKEIREVGDKFDMLKSTTERNKIKSGLERVKEEGWLSEKEYEVFDQKLV